jgi:hypothetical protein
VIPLKPRLATLPLILAGPILRRVTVESVTVWIALRKPAGIGLELYSGDPGTRQVVGAAAAHTVAVGRFLHILAITAHPVFPMTPGVVYTYDMSLEVDHSNEVLKLAQGVLPTSVPHPISYPPFDLPSFSLPPADANELRIIHGSCRMPHGDGPDALSILNELIRVMVQNATRRPHQLLLTGDQIYADDVAAVLLLQLMDASDTLLGTDPPIDPTQPQGWMAEETLPVRWRDLHTLRPSDFPPLTRTLLLRSVGFTSADLRSHLMAFGEYLCMYLFCWSDVLWPIVLPSPGEIEDKARASRDFSDHVNKGEFKEDLHKVLGDLKHVEVFQKTLPAVRRALANIPTYMIFDDHDVTDDWNMTPAFCNRVYSKDNPLGLRIVQNALVAYALCQLWGNAPEQFDFDAFNEPAAGRQLLTALHDKSAADYNASSAALQTIISVHDTVALAKRAHDTGGPIGVFHDQEKWLIINGVRVSANSLTYNFTYDYEKSPHQIIVTDTRSWRSYRLGEDATADLLPPDQVAVQIPVTPKIGNRVLIVVVTTNAPPVQPIRSATRHDTLSTFGSRLSSHDAHPDLFEAWEVPSLSFDRLLTALTNKFDPDTTGTRHGQVILLSGDVHHSFATRLSYDATNRYGDDPAQKARAVVAQLVASSFKKQTDDTVGFQREGYFYVPHFFLRPLIHQDMKEGYVGWNVRPNSPPYHVGRYKTLNIIQDKFGHPIHQVESVLNIRPITNADPTIQISPSMMTLALNIFLTGVDLTVPPDYQYTLEYLLPSSRAIEIETAPPIGPVPSGADEAQRKAALDTYGRAALNYRRHNGSAGDQQVIGRNNIGEVTFDWDHKKVDHTLRWRTSLVAHDQGEPDPDFPDTRVVHTTYTVNLATTTVGP